MRARVKITESTDNVIFFHIFLFLFPG